MTHEHDPATIIFGGWASRTRLTTHSSHCCPRRPRSLTAALATGARRSSLVSIPYTGSSRDLVHTFSQAHLVAWLVRCAVGALAALSLTASSPALAGWAFCPFSGTSELDSWVAFQHSVAWQQLERNIHPEGTMPGALVASPSTDKPDYLCAHLCSP